jgi:urease accessory protein
LTDLALLRLLQLADSALPVGAAAHSFGLETLTAEEVVTASDLAPFLRDYLQEAGVLEASACRAGFACGANLRGEAAALPAHLAAWREVNETLSAMKPARESRAASLSLGRRFLRLVREVHGGPAITAALESAEIHASPAFGFAGAVLGLDEDSVVLACLRQALGAIVSASQRLLPVGQTAASILLWELNADICATVERSRGLALNAACAFVPMLDCASMRHPALFTRLFIS